MNNLLVGVGVIFIAAAVLLLSTGPATTDSVPEPNKEEVPEESRQEREAGQKRQNIGSQSETQETQEGR